MFVSVVGSQASNFKLASHSDIGISGYWSAAAPWYVATTLSDQLLYLLWVNLFIDLADRVKCLAEVKAHFSKKLGAVFYSLNSKFWEAPTPILPYFIVVHLEKEGDPFEGNDWSLEGNCLSDFNGVWIKITLLDYEHFLMKIVCWVEGVFSFFKNKIR